MAHPLIFILFTIFSVVRFLIIAQVIVSLLINFDIINPRNRIIFRIHDMLSRVTEPMYGYVRRYVPSISGIDLAPLVILIGMSVIEYTVNYYFVWG